jgi:transposase
MYQSIKQGYSYREIARHIHLSLSTIRKILKEIESDVIEKNPKLISLKNL